MCLCIGICLYTIELERNILYIDDTHPNTRTNTRTHCVCTSYTVRPPTHTTRVTRLSIVNVVTMVYCLLSLYNLTLSNNHPSLYKQGNLCYIRGLDISLYRCFPITYYLMDYITDLLHNQQLIYYKLLYELFIVLMMSLTIYFQLFIIIISIITNFIIMIKH